ncbi:MAG: WecB/TagA/CpsF family glycosyltransferase [Prevotellaceae bacterium]|nr:WecB/TagA/CpsF family glycosyltransferase [Prevotellaceae bacterium]
MGEASMRDSYRNYEMIMPIFHINYEPDKSKVLSGIDKSVKSMEPAYICVADGNILTMVHKDNDYRKVVQGSMFSIVDSSWVPLFVKFIYGYKWQQYCGSQIFDDIIRMRKYRMYFLGSQHNVLNALRNNLTRIVPEISDMEFVELPFCNVGDFDYEDIAAKINKDSPDVIWLSLGAPKQEQFAARLVKHLDHGVVIPVGAVFNFRAGLGIKRAPLWMVKCHLEFAYRIFSEPKKQIKRCRTIVTTLPAIIHEECRRK